MFLSQTRLPHLLPPRAYFAAEQYERERSALLTPAWHAVATVDELERPGDFVTRDLFGTAVHVRNFDGELRALSNVCAHRHCLITGERCGNSARMTCQYHGWEYGPDGKTGRIPEPKNFVPFADGGERIPRYRLETCGRVVFVCLSDDEPGLAEFLGEYHEIIARRCGAGTKEFLRMDVEYAANWKVPVENSLEAYHVPSVHPNTFREDPTDARSTHLLRERSTAFGSALPFSPHSRVDRVFQRGEAAVVAWLGGAPTREYWQHHVFPNLLLSFTDAVSLVHSVIPTGPTTSYAVVRQFGTMGSAQRGPRRWLGVAWGKLKGAMTRQIMSEDLALIPHIQAGLERSPNAGLLGRCEERIHAFQAHVASRAGSGE